MSIKSRLSRMTGAALGRARYVARQLAEKAKDHCFVVGRKASMGGLYLEPFIGADKCAYGERPICAGDGVCEMSERVCECVGNGFRFIEPGRVWVHWDGSSWKRYRMPVARRSINRTDDPEIMNAKAFLVARGLKPVRP
jgi:hypothetical protein